MLAALVLAAATFIFAANDASPAQAARPGGGGTNSITLNQASPRLGDTVTFTYTLAKATTSVRIAVICYTTSVGPAWSADQPAGTAFLLGGTSSAWRTTGGEADCTAYLYRRNVVDGELARTYFHVNG